MRSLFATAAALAVAGPACGQEVKLTPLADVRVRHEHVEQDGIARNADAVTVRVRTGVQAARGPWSALVEAQGTFAPVDRYFDGLNGVTNRPLIADPENVALYRVQLQYRTEALGVTAGRQRIVLDDERFVGNGPIRANAQTYDAVRVQWSGVPRLKADLTYAWGVRTIWGVEGLGARPSAIDGDNLFANLSYATPVGTLAGFGYWIDLDEAAVAQFRQSTRTFGVRLAGTRPLSQAARLSYQLSYARQTGHHRNPNDFAASYALAEATLDVKGWRLTGGYEMLGADRGVALTSFQAPLGALFKFQGWADKFTTTPPNGVQDVYAGGGYGWRKVGRVDAITLTGVYHRFRSARLDQRYGGEIDLLASAKIRRTTISARYAHYDADGFATDTDKVWLQLDWIY